MRVIELYDNVQPVQFEARYQHRAVEIVRSAAVSYLSESYDSE